MSDIPPPPPPPTVADESVETTGSHVVRLVGMIAALAVLVYFTGWWGLVIVAGLVAMIFLHELGHFIMAKRAGMKVTEFFIGFGPRLWSFRRGETEYGFKAIPAGAYVKIIGMSMVEEVDEADEGRTYRAKPFWQRFGVGVAGSAMHFIQALVLLFVILVFTGAPGGTWALPTSQPQVTQIGDVYAHCPAAEAGIRPDDEVLAINGHRITDYHQLGSIVGPLAGKKATFLVRRNGVEKTLTAHIVGRSDAAGSTGLLGVTYGPKPLPNERVGVLKAIPQTFHEFGYMMWQTIPAFFKAFSPSHLHSFGSQVIDAQKDRNASESPSDTPSTTVLAEHAPASSPDSVSSQRCIASMGGPPAFKSQSMDSTAQQSRFLSIVGIFDIGKSMASTGGVAALLGLFVVVNIFIGVFNLIPMLPFDGGHVVIAIYEKIQEWRRGLRQRYYADLNKLLPVVYVMVALLGLLFVSSLYLDLANPPSVN